MDIRCTEIIIESLENTNTSLFSHNYYLTVTNENCPNSSDRTFYAMFTQ